MRSMIRLPACLMVLLAVLLPGGGARGAMPPDMYMKFARESPEVLCIRVTQVEAEDTWMANVLGESLAAWLGLMPRQHVRAEAEVERVVRSEKELAPGQSIVIEYIRRLDTMGMPGPRITPLIEVGSVIPAYLRVPKSGHPYDPGSLAVGALGFSFTKILESDWPEPCGDSGFPFARWTKRNAQSTDPR